MSQFLSLWSALLLVVCLLDRCHGDTPADCSYTDIRGTWTFYVGSSGQDNSIDCSGDFKTIEKLTVSLDFPDIATIKGSSEKGFWTMIYNQGFEVAVDGRKFFAFSNYSSTTFESYCYSTLNGWVHDPSGKDWGCYYGVKVPTTAYASGFSVTQEQGPFTSVDLDRKYVENVDYIHRINHATEHWQATHYPDLEGLTLRERLMRVGGPMSRPWPPVKAVPARQSAAGEGGVMDAWIQSYLDSLMHSSDKTAFSYPANRMELLARDIEETYTQRDIGLGRALDRSLMDKQRAESSQLAAADLPMSLDWRDVGGVNYVPPVRNQGDCGSCYAFSTTAMLSSRFKISSNGSVEKVFSPQDVVSCSQYSQGCAGGFPYLIAKYAEDFGVVEQSCSLYTGTDVTCPSVGSGCTRYSATDYQYIGGYYGACTESAMRVELALHGPIVIGYEVEADFSHYKSGIYMHTGLSDEWNPWMVVNHAVLVVGYGVEDGVKYWTVQNSWGRTWGEDGYFRIVRGTNEANCESIAVYAKPVLPVSL